MEKDKTGTLGWGLLQPPNKCDGTWTVGAKVELERSGLLERYLKVPQAFSGEWLVGNQPRDHFSCIEGSVHCFIDIN